MKRTIRTRFAVVAGAALARRAGALLVAGVLLNLCCVSVAVSVFTDGLITPLLPIIIETSAFVVATVISFAATGHREALVRSRLEQHLAPAVVRASLKGPALRS
jgi:adenylate cyclase